MVQVQTERESTPFASTVGHYDDPRLIAQMRQIPVPPRLDQLPQGRFHLSDELLLLARVLRAARREKALLLFSSRGRLKPELLAIACIGLWPRRLRPAIALYGEMYEADGGMRGRIQRLLIRLADKAVRVYILHSQAECQAFAQHWRVDRAKMRTAPVIYAPKAAAERVGTEPAGHVFAGGNSLRDYAPLVEAARMLPEQRFVWATRLLQGHPDLPSNVHAAPMPQDRFYTLMATASAVVIPLKSSPLRGAGQMSFLAAMWLKKPIIVADGIGVREYIEDGVNGLIVDGSAPSYAAALRWVFDPRNAGAVARLGERAHETVRRRFMAPHFAERILSAMEHATTL